MKKTVAGLLSAALFLSLLEIGLRLFPAVIPLALLSEFNPSVRSAIAERRHLQRAEDTIQLPRDDGGPPDSMWLYKGGIDVTQDFDEPGIVKTMRMDRRGFCNPSPDAYETERIDVAALGDSFTWCTNVEPRDAWPSVLERLTGLRVYNFGVPARGLYEYLQILKQFGLAKSPRSVVLAVYEGNDLRDAFRHRQAKGALSQEDDPCPLGSAFLCRAHRALRYGFLGAHSYAVNLIGAATWYGAQARQRGEIDFQYRIALANGVTVPFNTRNGDRDEVRFARRLQEGGVSLAVFDDALGEFVDLAREQGFVPIVVYIPSAYSGYGERARFDDPAIDGIMRSYSAAQRSYFAAQAERLGYRYLDSTQRMREAADAMTDGSLLYFRSNVHLTREGHEVVARAVAELMGRENVTGDQ